MGTQHKDTKEEGEIVTEDNLAIHVFIQNVHVCADTHTHTPFMYTH